MVVFLLLNGLAMISGYSRTQFYDISQGKWNPAISNIVKKAKDYIAFFDSQMAQTGKVPSPIYIFRSKNYYGMKDNQEVVITPNVSGQIPENAEDIINKLPERTEAE